MRKRKTTKSEAELKALGSEVTPNGDVTTDTLQSKFGDSSAHFDGSGDYLSMPNSSDFDFGSGDWAIDFQAKFIDTSTTQTVFAVSGGSKYIINIYPNPSSGYINIYNDAQTLYQIPNFLVSLDTWHHIAIVRADTRLYVFIDGVLINQGGTASTGTWNT